MRRWTKASSGGPFQHSLQALLFRTVSLAGGHGQRREKGQEKAINTLWNWCGSRKFRRRGEGKQRRIMYLLTALCSAWEKDDKNKMFFQFLSDIEFFFLLPFGHKPLAARFSVCLLVYLFVGDKYFCLMRHTSVLQHNKKKKKAKKWHVDRWRMPANMVSVAVRLITGQVQRSVSQTGRRFRGCAAHWQALFHLSICPSLWSRAPQYAIS